MMPNSVGILLFIVGMALGFVITDISLTSYYESKFAKTQCARYSPNTGEFEIIKEK